MSKSNRQPIPRALALGLFALVVALVVANLLIVGRFANQGVLAGIARLEFVADARGAARLIGDGLAPLTVIEIRAVERALLADFAVIALYSLGLFAGVRLLFPLFRLNRLRTNARLFALVALVPGVLDLLENLMLWIAITRTDWVDVWFIGATVFASAKFLLLFGFLIVFVGAVASGLATPDWLYRRLATAPDGITIKADGVERKLGIALSGGGVRAASLSLGALQELEHHGNLGWSAADRVTAVSGGSYMGGAWQLGRDYAGVPDAWARGNPNAALTEGRDFSALGPEEEHLLDNLGYLTLNWPRGRPEDPGAPDLDPAEHLVADRARSRPNFWAVILAGFVVNVVVMTGVLIVVAIPLGAMLGWLSKLPPNLEPMPPADLLGTATSWAPPVAWLLAGFVFALVWVLASKIASLGVILLPLKLLVLGSLALGLVLGILLVVLPLAVLVQDRLPDAASVLVWIAAAAGTIVAVARIVKKFLTPLAPRLGGVAFGVVLLVIITVVVRFAWYGPYAHRPFWSIGPLYSPNHFVVTVPAAVWLATVLLIIVGWAAFSPELWSMNAFYRGKLRAGYALHRLEDGSAQAYVNEADLAGRLQQEPLLGTYDSKLTVCASAHATTRGVRTHYKIPAMSLTFGDRQIAVHIPDDENGSYTVSSCSLEDLGKAFPGSGWGGTRRITTMFAVALSGAAVSPAMGRFNIGPTSMLLAFANVRMGAWLPNPRYVSAPGEETRRFPIVRVGYLFKEFFGWHDPTDAYVYVSDGGHWENTGLVELLRGTMPSEVILIDADAGNAHSVLQLSRAIDLAKLECGADVYVDLEPLRGFATTPGGPVFARQSVTFGVIRQGDRWGALWYAKPILTRATPTPLLAHREVDPQFPATSTIDQFFDTSTYFAYRDLGRYNGHEIKTARAKLVRLLQQYPTAEACLAITDWDDRHWVESAIVHLLHQADGATRESMFAGVLESLGLPNPPAEGRPAQPGPPAPAAET